MSRGAYLYFCLQILHLELPVRDSDSESLELCRGHRVTRAWGIQSCTGFGGLHGWAARGETGVRKAQGRWGDEAGLAHGSHVSRLTSSALTVSNAARASLAAYMGGRRRRADEEGAGVGWGTRQPSALRRQGLGHGSYLIIATHLLQVLLHPPSLVLPL